MDELMSELERIGITAPPLPDGIREAAGIASQFGVDAGRERGLQILLETSWVNRVMNNYYRHASYPTTY